MKVIMEHCRLDCPGYPVREDLALVESDRDLLAKEVLTLVAVIEVLRAAGSQRHRARLATLMKERGVAMVVHGYRGWVESAFRDLDEWSRGRALGSLRLTLMHTCPESSHNTISVVPWCVACEAFDALGEEKHEDWRLATTEAEALRLRDGWRGASDQYRGMLDAFRHEFDGGPDAPPVDREVDTMNRDIIEGMDVQPEVVMPESCCACALPRGHEVHDMAVDVTGDFCD